MANNLEDIASSITWSARTSNLTLFDAADVTSLRGIRIVDVGQGDCIGLLNQDDEVFCYVDYGGLYDHPDNGKTTSDPSKHRMPAKLAGRYVSIVLTHWDKDHYWSAHKKNRGAQHCRWIVPRQKVSPQAVRFAAKLRDAKRWPESIGDTPVSIQVGSDHSIFIRKCDSFDSSSSNQDRNLSGLAVTLIRWSEDVEESVIILPGDCPFNRIPSRHSGVPIRAFVAYHHGASAHWNSDTTRAIGNKYFTYEMIYSFGKNPYGHPDRNNYEPDWNSNSSETGDARRKGDGWIDVTW